MSEAKQEEQKEKVFNISLFKRLLVYLNPYKKVFFGVLFSVIIIALATAIRPFILQQAIDNNIATKQYEGFLPYILLMGGLLIVSTICQLIFIYFAGWLGQSMVKDIRVKLFEHMLKFKMNYYDNSSVGVLITRSVTDMERIADIFGQGLFTISRDLLSMIVLASMMLYMNWKLALIVLIMMPVMFFATKLFQKYMKKAFEEVRTEISNLNSFVQERVTGMKILQLFTREDIESHNFNEINGRHKKGWLKTIWYNSIFFAVVEILSAVTLGIVVYYGGGDAVANNTSSLGDLTAFIMMIPMLFRPLRQIADQFNTLQMGMVAAKRVFAILDTDSQIDDSGTTEIENLKGAIDFKNVHFSYVEDEAVLKGISFHVEAGKTVAIVGATGAGKSTVINLLNRFYDINKGTIYIDGTDIKEATIKSLRKEIAVVLQDVFLFADTILANITLNNPDITEADVINAAKQIGIHEFIMSLPNGYHYNVKERGVMLSSGQRQLISFLRAYVSNPSDKIIVMDAGEIVEEGTHQELLKKKDGYYKNLYEVQFLKQEVA